MIVKIDTLDGGRKVATLNGKSYTLLRGHRQGGEWLFLALAGKVPLKSSDLADHWKVVRRGDVYLAFSQRPFAYHLLAGKSASIPAGWPRLRAQPRWFCFVGLTAGAARHLARLALAEYRPELDLDGARTRSLKDECGGPDAILLKP